MMRLRKVIGFLLLPLLLLPGCGNRDLEQAPQLNLYIHVPQPALTRADEGTVPSESEAENAIHTLQIWVFLSQACAGHPAGYCLGYLAPDPQFLSQGDENRFAFPLESAVADAHPDVDVYVLANAAAAGASGLDAETPRSMLDGLVLDGNRFGILGTTPAVTAVPAEGLPFTGVGKGMKMKGSYPVLSLDVVKVRRAVSKLRFVVCQLVDEEGPFNDCSVTGARINGGGISGAEYLFNDGADPFKIVPDFYETADLAFPALSSTAIAGNTAPDAYAYDRQSAKAYEALILKGIEDGVLTSYGLSYLRETDRRLTGTIDYMLNGWPGSVNFEMKDPGDFARNHNWIVYLYFTRDAIRFTVSWTPWEEGHDFYLTD